MKREMQIDIFRLMLPISQSDVEERLTQADPAARKMASGTIIQRYKRTPRGDCVVLRSDVSFPSPVKNTIARLIHQIAHFP